MDNHLHLLLRLDPHVAEGWSDEEVVRRWLKHYPPRGADRKPLAVSKEFVAGRLGDAQWLTTTRERLKSLRMVRAVGDVFLSAVRERFAMLHGELDAATITPRVNAAIAIASSHEYQSCGVSADGRLLIGLATEQHGLAGVVLRELGIHADRLRASFGEPESSTEHNATVDEPDDVGASVSFVRQLTNAAECARTFGHDFIGTEHLALSLLAETNGDAARLIERLGVDPNSLRDVLAERTRKL